jgi:hypothetical protein
MKVGVINLSRDPILTRAVLEEICFAIHEQSFNDVAPFRQTAGVPCTFYPSATATVNDQTGNVKTTGLPTDTCPHLILDYPNDPGELGDHYATADGLPILRSYWGPTRDEGGTPFNELSVTMSHEHHEAGEDPYANAWVDLPDGKTEKAIEVADEVEAFSYKASGSRVSVTNVVSPRSERPGPGPYDLMGVMKHWDDLLPNCYRIIRIGGPEGDVRAVFGEGYSEQKKALKMLRHSRATRRGVIWTVELDPDDLPQKGT